MPDAQRRKRATKQRADKNLKEIRPGYWRVVVNIPASESPDGQRHRRVAYVTGGKRAADAKRSELITQRERGELKPRTPGSVTDYVHAYIEAKRPTVAVRTASRWQTLLDRQIAPFIGGKTFSDVKPRDLRKLYATLQAAGLSGTTRQKVHALLRQVFKQAIRDGDIAVNPILAVDSPTIDTPEAGMLTETQIDALLTAMSDSPLYVPVLVTLDLGVRRSELLALRWSDVTFTTGKRTDEVAGAWVLVRGSVEEPRGEPPRIKGTKSDKTRNVLLTKRAAIALADHKTRQEARREALTDRWEDNDLVFPAADEHRGKPAGRIWRPSSFSRALHEETTAAGLPIGAHILRHTYASTMLREEVPTPVVANQLGHSRPSFTEHQYQHVRADHVEAAVAKYERRMTKPERKRAKAARKRQKAIEPAQGVDE